MPAFDSAAFDTSALDVNAFDLDVAVTVPDVVGASQASGTSTLQGAGFTVRVVNVYSSTVASGVIASQDPAAGTDQQSGSQVTINVSIGDAPAVDHTARAKLLLMLRKKKRIKQRQEVKDGR